MTAPAPNSDVPNVALFLKVDTLGDLVLFAYLFALGRFFWKKGDEGSRSFLAFRSPDHPMSSLH